MDPNKSAKVADESTSETEKLKTDPIQVSTKPESDTATAEVERMPNPTTEDPKKMAAKEQFERKSTEIFERKQTKEQPN